jgi:hypothetical protein
MQQPLRSSATVLALTLGLSSVATAQTQPAPQQWSVITTIQIKPEFRQEYEAAQKEISAAYKKAGLQRVVVQTILGDVDEYISIAPLAKFAEMDGPSLLSQPTTLPQPLVKRVTSYMTSMHRVTYLSIPEISIRTEMDNPGDYAHVTVFHLAPGGKVAAFNQYMKDDYLPAMRKADVANLWLSRPIFGGDLSDRVMVRPLHKLAVLDGGPVLTKALGAEEAAKINAKMSGIVESTHFTIVRVRPDLSNMPGPPAKAKSSE